MHEQDLLNILFVQSQFQSIPAQNLLCSVSFLFALVQGVKVLGIVESNAPIKREYSPGHPQADDKGFISLPNVNVAEEMANMISASRSYQTNVQVADASKQMLLSTLRMGQ